MAVHLMKLSPAFLGSIAFWGKPPSFPINRTSMFNTNERGKFRENIGLVK
jgi:hypothetical protein